MTETHDLIHKKEEILSHFQCQGSGNCCKAEGVVYITPKEAVSMAQELGVDITTFYRDYTKRKNGWTVIADQTFRANCFLTDCNQCQVYDARPEACQTYPNWPEIWASDKTVMKEADLCPGLKKAINSVSNGEAIE